MAAPKEPLSSSEVDVLDQAAQLLVAGEVLRARSLYLSLLQSTTPRHLPDADHRLTAISGLILAAALQRQAKSIDDSIQSLKTELEFLQQSGLGPAQVDRHAELLNQLCEKLGAARSWKPVKQISRLIIRYLVDESPSSHSHRIRALNNLGSGLLAEGRHEDAIHVWQCTIKDYQAKAAQTCPSPLATIHNNLAELSRLQTRISFAITHHFQALELRLSCFPEQHLLVRQSRLNLAQVLIEAWRFSEALEQVDAYLKHADDVAQENPAEHFRALILKGRILTELGRYLTAEKHVNQFARSIGKIAAINPKLDIEAGLLRLELAIRLGKDNLVQSVSSRLADQIQKNRLSETVLEGRYQSLLGITPPEFHADAIDNREAHLQHALRIFRSRLPRNHPQVAITIFHLADLFAETQRGQRAIQTANSAMAILEQIFGEQSLPVMFAVTRLGKVVLLRAQFKTVRQLMKLAFNIAREQTPAPPVCLLQACLQLSRAYEGLQKGRLAAWYARAGCRKMKLPIEIPVAQELAEVDRAIRLSHAVRQFAGAIEMAARKVELLSQEFHADHPHVNQAVEQLGRLYAEAGDAESAAAYLSQILTVRCGELGEETPLAIELMELTAKLHHAADQHEKAELIEEQLLIISQKSSHVLSDLL